MEIIKQTLNSVEFSASDLTHNLLICFLQNTPVSTDTVPVKYTKLISHD